MSERISVSTYSSRTIILGVIFLVIIGAIIGMAYPPAAYITYNPTSNPTESPTGVPSEAPTKAPTAAPTPPTAAPTGARRRLEKKRRILKQEKNMQAYIGKLDEYGNLLEKNTTDVKT